MSRQSVKKRIVILKHNGGRLGNQLLLLCSVYAFCLENKYEFVNYSFYNYWKYFEFKNNDWFIKILGILGRLNFYKAHSTHLIIYHLYTFLANIYIFFNKGSVIHTLPSDATFLPPSSSNSRANQDLVIRLVESKKRTIYLAGWTFRNPVGIRKYHQEIRQFLRPRKEILQRILKVITPLRRQYKNIIGVHIRQGDYKVWQGGKYYFSQLEVASILETFLLKKKLSRKQSVFLICSDGYVDQSIFHNLNVKIGPGSLIEDLFSLSECDLVIGSNSTFGRFAAYYGNRALYFFDRKKKFVKQNYGF